MADGANAMHRIPSPAEARSIRYNRARRKRRLSGTNEPAEGITIPQRHARWRNYNPTTTSPLEAGVCQ